MRRTTIPFRHVSLSTRQFSSTAAHPSFEPRGQAGPTESRPEAQTAPLPAAFPRRSTFAGEEVIPPKGSVVSKVPLLHLHCRELVLPNIAKFLCLLDQKFDNRYTVDSSKPDVLQFVASMPTHMKISWNLMSSYLV
ncbi:hypothetical protein ACLB2K_047041 [Fragaria x ananassa]